MKKKAVKKYWTIISIITGCVVTSITFWFEWDDHKINAESIAFQKSELKKNRFMLSIIPKVDSKKIIFTRPFGLKKITEKQFETRKNKRQLLFYPMTEISCKKNNLQLSQYDSLSYLKKLYFFELDNGYLEDFKITKSYSVRQINGFTDSGHEKQITIPLHNFLIYKYTGKQQGSVIEVVPNIAYLEIFGKCIQNALKTENYKHFAIFDYNMIEVRLGNTLKHYNLDKGIMISPKEFNNFVNIYDSYNTINVVKLNNIMNSDYIHNWYDQNKKLIVNRKKIPITPGSSYILETCSSNRDSIMSMIKIVDSKGNLANTLKF